MLCKVLNGLQDEIGVLHENVNGLKESGLGFEMFLKVRYVAKLSSATHALHSVRWTLPKSHSLMTVCAG